MIKDILGAAGITTVVWVDDHFASPSKDEIAVRIQQYFEVARAGRMSVSGVARMAAIDFSRPRSDLEADLDTLLGSLDSAQMEELAEQLRVATGASPASQVDLKDLPPEDFVELKSAFGAALNTFSLTDWESRGIKTFGASGADTLFLIDRDYTRERQKFDGLDIVKGLVLGTKAFCVVLTYMCGPNERDSHRVKYAEDMELPTYKFSVLSKQPHKGESVLPRFARAIYEAYSQRLTGIVAYAMEEVVRRKSAETAVVLSAESIYDVDKAVFENSFEEGVSECEVLLRIFHANEKAEILKLTGTETIQASIRAMRHFRRETEKVRSELGYEKTDLPRFRQWRKDEVFIEGDLLNAVHSPIACGDLFDVTVEDGNKKRYVLIAQPCDLMVRGRAELEEDGDKKMDKEGERSAATAILAPVTIVPPGKVGSSKSPYRYFDVIGILEKGEAWRIDFLKTWQVNLDIVDLTVFNSEGHASLRKDQELAVALFATGWEKRLKSAKNWFPAKPKKAPTPPHAGLGPGSAALDIEVHGGDTSIAYPLQRVGRFENDVGTAILAAWSIFQTRAAFDHDFARHSITHKSDGAAEAEKFPEEAQAKPEQEGLFSFLRRWFTRSSQSLIRRLKGPK